MKNDEFHPINMLPKVWVMCVMYENNIFIEPQLEFWKSHSCKTSLNLVLKQWKEEIDKDKVVIGVFLELKRAFKTIDRNLLLRKFERDSVRNNKNQ
jgi:hypothetical protein